MTDIDIDFEHEHEFEEPSIVEEHLMLPATLPDLETPGQKARRFMRERKQYMDSEAKRTAALTWAQLEAAEATDRQTAVLKLIATNLQIQAQIALYNTPAAAFPSEGVRDQFKANLGISVRTAPAAPEAAGDTVSFA